MPDDTTNYRGYLIRVFGDGQCWHFAANPITPDFPILTQPTFAAAGLTASQALSDAKQRIDRLFG